MKKQSIKTKSSFVSTLDEKISTNGLKLKSASVIAGISMSMLAFTSVDALNIGEAKSESFIGQPLNIFIPVDNSGQEIDFNQLIVSKPTSSQLSALNISSVGSELSYQVINEGDKQGIQITTEEPFSEPFINLGLKVDYEGTAQLKKLTALIDFEPISIEYNSELSSTPLVESQDAQAIIESNLTSLVDISESEISNTGASYSTELMGPYDWARSGAIPTKFGPVLEGQSLWRVARRINEAMDVSIDQMMWGLFRANPEAFSGNDVSSLIAGSVLTVPNEAYVREFTEMGAVRMLNPELVESDSSSSSITNSELVSEETNSIIDANEKINSESEQVQTTEIVDEAALSSPTDELAITSDNSTVQEEVEAFDSIVTDTQESTTENIVINSNSLEALETVEETSSDNVLSLSTVNEIDVLKNEVDYLNQQVNEQALKIQDLEQRLAEAEASAEAALNSVNSLNAQEADSKNTILTSFSDNNSMKLWSIAALGLFLLGLAYIARNKISGLFGDPKEQQADSYADIDYSDEMTEEFEPVIEHQTIEGNYEEPVTEVQETQEVLEEIENQRSDYKDVIQSNTVKKPESDGFEDFEDYSFFVADD